MQDLYNRMQEMFILFNLDILYNQNIKSNPDLWQNPKNKGLSWVCYKKKIVQNNQKQVVYSRR